MNSVSISTARANLFHLAQSAIESHRPVLVTSKHGSIVLLSADDFNAIQETLHLQAIPGLVEDVKAGRKARKKDLATRDALPW